MNIDELSKAIEAKKIEEKEDRGKKAASSRESGKKGGRPCNHCAGDGGASDYDRTRYRPGDECASCGCTLGTDWYWYIDRDQAPGYPDFE